MNILHIEVALFEKVSLLYLLQNRNGKLLLEKGGIKGKELGMTRLLRHTADSASKGKAKKMGQPCGCPSKNFLKQRADLFF